MAFGNLSSDGGEEGGLQSEINMIPMIDVMLVLLIVFMITAPLLTNAVKLELPQATSQVNEVQPKDITLSVTADGVRHWNGKEVDEAQLLTLMQAAAKENPLPELQLQVDKSVEYGEVAMLMAQASQQGLDKLAFVSAPKETQ